MAGDAGRQLRAETREQLLAARARIGSGGNLIETLMDAEPELLELERQLGHQCRIDFGGRRYAARARRLRNLLQVACSHSVDDNLHGLKHAAHFGEHEIALIRCQQNSRAPVGRDPRLTANEEEGGDGNGNKLKADGRDG
jgi:hypothetical protein